MDRSKKITAILLMALLMLSTVAAALAPPAGAVEQVPEPTPAGVTSVALPSGSASRLDPLLREEIEARPGEKIPVIIMMKEPFRGPMEAAMALAMRTQRSLRLSLEQIQAENMKHHWIINAISAEVLAERIAGIAARQDVKKVWLDARVRLIEPLIIAKAVHDYGDVLIGAPALWNKGYDGTGIVISILDTGIDKTHPDLIHAVILERDFTDDGTPEDLQGHGTHVAGIAAGRNTAGVSGVAPGASLLNAKVLNRFGFGQISWIISGIEWSIENEADILNMSLGGWPADGRGRDPMSVAATNAVNQGVIVVTAAGNSGPGEGTMASPAVAHGVIAVGASDINDAVAEFSSRGPAGDGRVGIDLTAPGVAIIAPVPLGGHKAKSGTSMAAPHVAGAIALLLQAIPGVPPGEIESLLKNSADNIAACILEQGAGRLDVADALHAWNEGVLVDYHEWFAGKVSPGSIIGKTFTVTNNTPADIALSITKSDITDTQGTWGGGLINLSTDSLTVPAGGEATFTATINVIPVAVGTYIGRIELHPVGIVIPLSFNVIQRLYPTITATITGTVDECGGLAGLIGIGWAGDRIFYTLEVPAGIGELRLELVWSELLADLDLYLFDPHGMMTESVGLFPEKISYYFPMAGLWTAVIHADLIITAPVSYVLEVEVIATRTIYVPDHYPTIQAAVDAANPGDKIIVRAGTYIENVNVTKSLVIKSEEGPQLTIVQAANPDDHVFQITADRVVISGFTVTGATRTRKVGIGLEGVSRSEIVNNIVTGNWGGIGLARSHRNIIRQNIITNNTYGIGITGRVTCAVAEAVYRTEITADPEGTLNLLRNLRDKTLRDKYVNLFYKHSPEVTRILIENPRLLLESARLIMKYIPAVRYVLGHGGKDLEITEQDVTRVVSFIQELSNEITERRQCIGTERTSEMIRLLQELEHEVKAAKGQRFSQAFRNSVYYIGNEVAVPHSTVPNHIYLNNFVNNQNNFRIEVWGNVWNSPTQITYIFQGHEFTGYLGNHWDDYEGVDADGDGIGDTPHTIGRDRDNYPLMKPFEKYVLYDPGPIEPISARIDNYTVSPRNVPIRDKVTIGFTFTNTGNVSHTFGAGATLRKPDGTEIDFLNPVTVAPGKSGSAQWTHIIDMVGRWDIVFGVWEESTHPLENLLVQTGWVPEYIYAREEPPPIEGDVNRDGRVDGADLALVAAAFNSRPGMPNWNPAADLNHDGIVDIFDLVLVGRNFGKSGSPQD